MTKCIVLSDIHINDWQSEVPGSRLNNYLKLAEIVKDKVVELNAPWVFIAGDIIERPILPPHVVTVLHKFLLKILESGCKIGYILGQHDQNSRELEDLKDTYLNVFTDDKVVYLHQESLMIDGKKLYFENFTRSMEVNPLQESDIYISHVTLGRQAVHNDKFKLGIFGDIHDVVDIGNMHSVCPPICNHAHEYPYGVIGILTIDETPTFERWIYDKEFKIFPKLEKVEKKKIEKEGLTEEDKKVIDILSYDHDFYKDIEEAVKAVGLSEIHHDIDMTGAPEPISLDFKIKKVYARDFKSIKDMCFELDNLGKIIFIQGKNGSGKTSIMEAIYVALVGDRRLRENYQTLKDGSDVMVGLELEYKGSTYEIARGAGWTKFIINGDEVQKGNKAELEKYIVQCLPFITLVNYFYIQTFRHFFDNDRVSLVKKCFNLDIFDFFFERGASMLKAYNNKLATLKDRTNQLKGQYDQEKSNLAVAESDLKSYESVNIEDEGKIKHEINKLNEALANRASIKNSVEQMKYRISKLEDELSKYPKEKSSEIEKKIELAERCEEVSSNVKSLNRSIESYERLISQISMVKCPNCGTEIQVGGEAKSELESQLAEAKLKLENEKTIFADLFNKIPKESVATLNKMLKSANQREYNENQLSSYKEELETLYSNLRDADFNLSNLPESSELQEKLIDINKKKVLLMNKQRSLDSINTILIQAKELKVERQKTSDIIDKCEKYVNLFNMKNLDSLPYKLLEKISKFLSTDRVQFKTYSELANGNLKLDISCKMKVGQTYIDYDRCSHGQKTVLDFFILSRFLELLGTTGFLGIDEGLSALNIEAYDEVCETIKDLQANNVFITSHQAGFSAFDSLISCVLNEEGQTEWQISGV